MAFCVFCKSDDVYRGTGFCKNCWDTIDEGKVKYCSCCGKKSDFLFCYECTQKYSPTINNSRQPVIIQLDVLEKFISNWHKKPSEKVISLTKRRKVTAWASANRKPITVIYECPCDAEKKHKHHPDYSKPTEVIVLCPKCHGAEHRRLNRLSHPHVVTDVTG